MNLPHRPAVDGAAPSGEAVELKFGNLTPKITRACGACCFTALLATSHCARLAF